MSKVAVVRCGDYEAQRVFDAVSRAVGLVGGMTEFVRPGMKVLLKPNLLSPRPPEDAVDTHPEVIRAVIRLAREAGAASVMAGDSPGGYGQNIKEILEKSGVGKMLEEEGVEFSRFTTSRFVDGIPIARQVFDADCLISIPKLKTHSVTILTAAVKNMFGTVTGLYKAECHSRSPKDEDFAKVIAKVYSISKPRLTVLDGIVAMEGDGPSAGEPRRMNVVMAGADAVAIDACVAGVIGLKPADIAITKEAHAAGLGEADMSEIEVAGDDISTFAVKDFKLPQTTPLRLLPRPVIESLAGLVRFKPQIDEAACRRCNLCKTSCAVGAITIGKDSCAIDYDRCVRCMCCHEVCPYKAIHIRRNILTRWIWG